MEVSQAQSAVDLHKLPHTIEDALCACQHLGQKYLWVDQICINQDDPADKANQIASMAAIYSSASVVIIAAYGESVRSGISGMHLVREKLQARASFLDFEFVSVPDFNRDISSSIWSTRGWTLQEAVLANTKLYFSSTGVWLNYQEETYQIFRSFKFHLHTGSTALEWSTFFDFSDHLQRYTSRQLTYEYDIYNAFSGIIMALFGGPEKDVYGLPEQHFDQTLLWAPSEGGPARSIRVLRNYPDRDPVPNPILPTWSWASVTGESQVTRAGRLGNMVPLVKWARTAPCSQPPTPTVIEPQTEKCTWNRTIHGSPEFGYFLAVLWSHSGFDSPSPFAPMQPGDDTQTSEREFGQRWPSPRDFWHEVSSGSSRSPTYPGLGIIGLTGQDDSKISQLQPGVLLTRAQSTYVWVNPDGYFRVGDHGALIGQLYGRDRGLIPRGGSPKAGVFKCIAISLAHEPNLVQNSTDGRWQDPVKSVVDRWSHEKRLRFYSELLPMNPPGLPPVINVMLIRREGQFSYRLGIGWVLFNSWIKAERVFETILLK